uniref:Uncharacterized protein n=1 Tax=Anguilla anguilla TaxID=7936 RepID=A0A0E9QHT9_ANGAN
MKEESAGLDHHYSVLSVGQSAVQHHSKVLASGGRRKIVRYHSGSCRSQMKERMWQGSREFQSLLGLLFLPALDVIKVVIRLVTCGSVG